MLLVRLTGVACLVAAFVVSLGCEDRQGRKTDLSKMVFLSEREGARHACFVFPVYNGTGQLRHPYRSHYLGLHILSVEADGKPMPPQHCSILLDEPLDMSTMILRLGDWFAYTVWNVHDNELISIRAISESQEKRHDFVKYVIGSFSVLKVRYAVRDGVSGDTFYDGTATFADRLPGKDGAKE